MKRKNKKKRFYINRKAFAAVLLSLTLAFASVSSIQAEELNVEVLPEVGEEPPADTGEPVDGESTEGTENGDGPVYVRTPDGAVVLSAFVPLSEAAALVTLEERETLAELTARMPKTLKAYAGAYISESPDAGDEDKKPEEGEKDPGNEDKKPEGGEKDPEDEDKKPEEGEKDPGDEDKNPEEGEKDPGDEDKKPEEGEKDPGDEDKSPEEGEKDPGDEDEKPEEGEKDPGDEDKSPEDENENPGGGQSGEAGNSTQDEHADVEDNTVTQEAGGEAWWHLFVASDTKDIAEDGAENLDETKNPEDGDKTPEDETKNPEDGDKTPEDGGKQPSEEPAIQPVEVEIPVTWECAEYEPEEQQGEQEEQKEEKYEYVFTPKWDSTLWFYDMTAEGAVLPTITVRYEKEEAKAEVSTQEELAAAFAAGLDKIVLRSDIALTMTLMLPATAKIELDGEGHSLLRGAKEDGAPFPGTMIAMEGEGYTEETFGTLTLRNITIDGKTETDSAAAPAILDRGELILEENAVVCNNDNYGAYPAEEEDGAETIFAYGGGIQVYGKLTLTERSLVTGNYADELGGGVYLADGAALWLYADVIRENTVSSEHGYGADLYAASGSTIYYDPSIDMTREGFYLCEGVTLIPMGEMALMANSAGANGKEIFLHVAKNSGYTDEQVEAIKTALREKGYTVLTDKRVNIDTTDLRDWYVYDHYDTDDTCWGAGTTDKPPQKWLDVYGGGEKRKFYPYYETQKKKVTNPATTIKEWLTRLGDTIETDNYMGDRRPLDGVAGIAPVLSNFKEHIYAREENGYSAMTFVGYGQPAYVDFLFYDPESDGEKVVDFDVDSSDIFTHTMVGSGFLVNTGVNEKNLLSGYLVYYAYAGREYPHNPENTKALSVTIYQIDGVNADNLHGAAWDFHDTRPTGFTEIASAEITDWNDQMSVQIKVAPDRIEVRQQPKSESRDISECEPILDKKLSQKSVYSGFGPLVAYTSYQHICMMASGFTFSNLRMYFTDAQEEQSDVMKSFERADFTQRDTQRYFVNLLGNSEGQYNSDVNFGQYREYLKLLQEEGVALVTDRDTPFDEYLGKANEPDSNLVELSHDGGLLSVEKLVEKIHERLKDKTTTEMADKVGKPADEGGVLAPEVHHSAGNIWLKSVTDGSQVRKLYGDAFGDGGYAVQIMDDITYYHGSRDEVSPVAYEVLKPGTSGYVSVSAGASSGGGDAAPNSMGQTDDGIMITPPPFVVEKNKETWPAGTYVVRQTVKNGSVLGYSFFDMVWGEQPPVVPDTPIPDPPDPEEPEPNPTPTPPGSTPDPTPEPEPEPTPGPGSSLEDPPAEYTEETVTITAAETVSSDAEPMQETEKKPGEPKTGDVPMPVLPVSVGACTAFVMKLRLWLYELETGIVEEKKNEMIRAIIAWAKNTNIIKVYLALAATAVVVTVFHLLKTVCGGKRQVVASFER